MPNSIISISAPVAAHASSNIATATNLDELLSAIPRMFQPAYRPVLRECHDLGVKLSHAQHSLATFERHVAGGTFPPLLLGSLKGPTLQCSKEFTQSSSYQSWTGTQETAVFNTRKDFLDGMCQAKRMEVDLLQGLLAYPVLAERAGKITNEVWNLISSSFARGISAEGVPQYSGQAVDEKNMSHGQGPAWLQKAMAIGLAKHQRELVGKMSKLSLKKDTDVDMGNLSTNDITKTIQDNIASALRKAGVTNRTKGGDSLDASRATLTSCRQTQKEGSEEPFPTAARQTEACQKDKEKGCRKRKREAVEETQEGIELLDRALTRKGRFNPRDVSSYPSDFFRMPSGIRSRFLLLHSSVPYVDSLSTYRSEIFYGPGVNVPGDIAQQLALNGKFCLHSRKKLDLVPQAVVQLERSLRLRYFFKDKKGSKGLYIPRFHVKTDWEPPSLDPRIEKAISHMKAALFRQVDALPQDSFLRNPETSSLREFLTRRKYLVKITDKNLGLAIVSDDWYLNQCRLHLEDSYSYAPRQIKIDPLLQQLHDHVDEASYTPAIARWLRTTTSEVPRFHVIPKVHKEPWSSRPIIPSHSWLTSKASEVVDYFLQPLLKKFPTVLTSTRQLIETIRKIEEPLSNCWLVTGDVKAMYTNIHPSAALESIQRHLGSRKREKWNKNEDIMWLLSFVLHNNVFQFQDDTYQQKSGLAMGTACAPAVANLLCAEIEETLPISPILPLKYYGRYIDDIFIIYQGTEDDLKCFLEDFRLGNLEISWTWSQNKIPFLDVEIILENSRLVTRLYKKNLNKHMYIPFSSAHPLSVKKGMVKAERTRMTMICSEKQQLLESQRALEHNLLRRGYPARVLDAWFREDLGNSPNRESVLLLPSKYNPVWEHINMQKLEDAFYGSVSEEFVGIQTLKNVLGKITLGLKRSWNMFDIYNRENMTVLQGLATGL